MARRDAGAGDVAGAGTAMDKAPETVPVQGFSSLSCEHAAQRSPPSPATCPQNMARLIGTWTMPGKRGKSPRMWRRPKWGAHSPPETQTQENELGSFYGTAISKSQVQGLIWVKLGGQGCLMSCSWERESQGGMEVQGGNTFRPSAGCAEGEGRPEDRIGAEPLGSLPEPLTFPTSPSPSGT